MINFYSIGIHLLRPIGSEAYSTDLRLGRAFYPAGKLSTADALEIYFE